MIKFVRRKNVFSGGHVHIVSSITQWFYGGEPYVNIKM